VDTRKFHEIWIEQRDAAQEIKLRYGLKAAFDYVVAEKLLNFAGAAGDRPEFARQFATIKELLTAAELGTS
jgi:hypothetical protein